MSDVVAHWRRIIHSFNVGRMPNTVLVFDSYCLDEVGRQGLRAKNVKFWCCKSAEISYVNCLNSTWCR